MKKNQSGFTLVEIAIVLVVVGLLLGSILKGQELINNARVKSIATDFRLIPTFLYGYQDKFRALPGDDKNATNNLPAPPALLAVPANKLGNFLIEGNWNTVVPTDESWLFWQHVRLAGLASGSTTWTVASASDPYVPVNALGGRIGVSSAEDAQIEIDNQAANPGNPMHGSYQLCSSAIPGKFVKQLDLQMDDGNTATGAMRAHATAAAFGSASVATAAIVESTLYTVCYMF